MPVRAVPSTRTALALGSPSVTPYRVAQVERLRWDSSSNSGYQTGQSSYSWSHTIGDLANRTLIVAVAMLSVAGSKVNALTFNGTSMIFVRADTSPSTLLRTEFWRLTAPASGVGTIAVTLSAALDSVGMATSWAGTLQVEPVDAETGTGGTLGPASATVVPLVDGTVVIDALATADSTVNAGAGQVERVNVAGTLGTGGMSTREPLSPQASVIDTWNVDALLAWSQSIIAIAPVGAIVEVPFEQVTEIDTAQPFTSRRTRGFSQTTETDTAQPFAWAPKRRLIVQTTETDTAQAFTVRKTRAVAQASETDTAQPFTVHKTRGFGQATETDLAQAFTPRKTASLGRASETDTAQPFSAKKTHSFGQVAETDQAQPAAAAPLRRLLVTATETDVAQPMGHSKGVTLIQASEADTAFSWTHSKAKVFGQASEVDTAQQIRKAIIRVLGISQETDLAQAVTHHFTAHLGQVSETDTAQAFGRLKRVVFGQASEHDAGQSFGALKSFTIAMAEETDIAIGMNALGGKQIRRDLIYPTGRTREEPASGATTRKGPVTGATSRKEPALAGTSRKGPVTPGNPR